ncbi:carbon-nitrogen hydrolase family protein [Thermococcus gammatolerans]|uniref:Carbon-nitrogen hydrolase n=1 Tax=Thermococcus gammatolerans (strain DSM 15229 / JCM 11827 / EJ3) TaxID=593117 RepID=C5A795_THEGJ|nr:carbon-nitrogen hydrolase family protein [Thermococcus gammatolerans]ACS34107.1 Carbon-nitrogen hydrolase [Thermococcus gammatolerans EJ3]
MKVALIPMRVEVGNFETNWREFERRFNEALMDEPDFVVFPEYCLTGFEEWDFSGAGLYDEILGRVTQLAREAGVYVVFGLLEPYKNCVYNSALLIGRNGEVLLKHRKFQEPMKFCTGNTVRTARTEFGKAAIIICGDLYNKRIAKWVRRKRPDFIFVPMEYSPDYGEPNEEDVGAMAERVKLLGAKTFVVNSHPPGGAWAFDGNGKLRASSKGAQDLVVEIEP